MNTHGDTDVGWCKSSYSGTGNGDCVEVGFVVANVVLRDTKARAAGQLTADTKAWAALARNFAAHAPVD